MGEYAVSEGQHCVHRIEGWPPAAPVKAEYALVIQYELIQHAEIGVGPVALQPAQPIQRGFIERSWQKLLDLAGSVGKRLCVHPHTMIPLCALNAPAGIIQLAEYHAPGDTAAFGLVIRRPILCPPKQHIAVDLAAYPYKEPAPRRAQRHAYAPFCTFAHQCRRKPGIGKANYALQRVQRIAGKLLLIPVRDCVFAVKGQVNILRHGIQRVKQLFHGSTSIALRRYSLTSLSFMSLGIQTSFSEQALQAFDGFTLGVYPRQ